MSATIKEISEKTGWSTRKIQRLIANHIELGIVTEERKKTVLTQYQASQVCALIAQENLKSDAEIAEFSQNTATENNKSARVSQDCADLLFKTATVAELTAPFELINGLHEQISELKERASKSEGRAEELEKQIEDLKAQREKSEAQIALLQASNSRLLESSGMMERRAEKAEAELAVEKKKSWWDKLLGR